jgi:hypothetical protein
LFVKGTQTCVLTSKTSTTGDVDDQAELTFELREPDGLPRDRERFEIVKTGHRFLSVVQGRLTRAIEIADFSGIGSPG